MYISRKIRLPGALLAGVLVMTGGCTTLPEPQGSRLAPPEALSHFSLALLAEAGGDPESAWTHLEKAIRLDPGEERLYPPAIAIALELNRNDEALRLAKKLAAKRPEEAEPQLLLARVCAVTGRPEEAEEVFRRSLKEFPGHPDTPLFLARFLIAQERRAEAFEVLRKSTAENPDCEPALRLLGALCIDSGRNLPAGAESETLLREGIHLLKKAQELAPDDPSGWQQLAIALTATRRPEEALAALREARRIAPGDRTLSVQLLELLIATGNYREAIESHDLFAAETATEPDAWLQVLAERLPEPGQTDLAQWLGAEIAGNPNAPVFYYTRLGSLLIGTGKNDEALDLLTRAMEHYPGDNRIRIVLGYLHLQQNRPEEAYRQLAPVRDSAPENDWADVNPFFLFNFLMAAQRSGRLEEAAAFMAKAGDTRPEIPLQYLHQMLTGPGAASTDQALELFDTYRAVRPDSPDALYCLMLLRTERKEYGVALELGRQYEQQSQQSGNTNRLTAQFFYQYAALHERTGQLEKAEELFRETIRSGDPALTPAAQNYIAYMWAERGKKLDQGLKLIGEALAAQPDNGAFLDTLGWIYYMQGRYAEALIALKKAVQAVPDDPTVREHLGDTYLKLGDRESAMEYWKQAAEIDPDSPALRKKMSPSQ